mgnify:CR=1 FL=1
MEAPAGGASLIDMLKVLRLFLAISGFSTGSRSGTWQHPTILGAAFDPETTIQFQSPEDVIQWLRNASW